MTFATGPEGENQEFARVGRALQKGSTEKPDAEAGESMSSVQMGSHWCG